MARHAAWLLVLLAVAAEPGVQAAFPAFDTTLAWTLVSSDWRSYPDVVAHFARPLYENAPDIFPVHLVGPGQTPGASATVKSALFAVTNTYNPAIATSVLLAVYTYSADLGYTLSSLRVLEPDDTLAFFSDAANDRLLSTYISDVDLAINGSVSQCSATGTPLTLDSGNEEVYDFLYPSSVDVEGAEAGQVNIPVGCNLLLYSTTISTHYYSKNVPYNESCIAVSTLPSTDLTFKASTVCSTPELLEEAPVDTELTGEAGKHAKATTIALLTIGYLGREGTFNQRAAVYIPSVTFHTGNKYTARVHAIYEPRGYFSTIEFLGSYTTTNATYTVDVVTGTITEDVDTDQNTAVRCFQGNYTASLCVGATRLLYGASSGTTVTSQPCSMPVISSPCPPSPPSRSPSKEQWIEWRDGLTAACVGVTILCLFVALCVVLFT